MPKKINKQSIEWRVMYHQDHTTSMRNSFENGEVSKSLCMKFPNIERCNRVSQEGKLFLYKL